MCLRVVRGGGRGGGDRPIQREAGDPYVCVCGVYGGGGGG